MTNALTFSLYGLDVDKNELQRGYFGIGSSSTPNTITLASTKGDLELKPKSGSVVDATGPIKESGTLLSEKYASLTHNHTIANVTGLQTALDGKADDADLTPLITKTEADGKYELKGAGGKTPLQVTSAPVTTPEFIGQTAIDTINKRTYIAEGLTAGDWRRLTGQNYVDLADSVIVNTTLGGLKFAQMTRKRL